MDHPHGVVDIHRHFDAPCEHVYRAFTDADQLAAWFGPVGVLVLRDSVAVDATVGGYRRLTMVTYDGSTRWSVETTFTDVVENRRLIGYETVTGLAILDGDKITLRQEFVDEGGGTRLELWEGLYSTEVQALALEFWLQSFTKLDALLAG
ncbi:MAG: SRPBCC domain-containing protein [Aeromicrobium sp.]